MNGINDFTDFGRVSEKGNDLLPNSAPALDNGRNFLAPGAFGELLEPLGGQLSAFGAVDPLQFTGNGLALLAAAEREVNYGSNAQ